MLNNFLLQLGTTRKVVNLKVSGVVVLGDMQGGDKICCSSATYTNKMNRMCRKCNVPGQRSDDVDYTCTYISQNRVIESVRNNDEVTLQSYNQYNVHTPWFDINYGNDPCGIFSAACPVESLHALDLGLIQHSLSRLWSSSGLSLSHKVSVDAGVAAWSKLPRQRLMSPGSHPV